MKSMVVLTIQLSSCYYMILNTDFQCPVCCNTSPASSAYSVGNCDHLFCRSCCLQQIEARLGSFEAVRCLTNNCSQKLTKNSPIYSQLSSELKRKFERYEQFTAIQNNRNLKPCNNGQCLGLINLAELQWKLAGKQRTLSCKTCKANHCIQCFSLKHVGQQKCQVISEEAKRKQQQSMKSLNFRRCPSCSIWVEKNGGCRYLVCKCKTQFCFSCGSKFQNDPCRKIQVVQTQMSVRSLSKISHHFHKPESIMGYLCFLPKFILKLVFILLFTILSGLIFMALIFGFLIPLMYLISPALFIIFIGQSSELDRNKILAIRILLVILYPLVGFVIAVMAFFIFVTYPVMRVLHGAHMYDEFDRFMHQMSELYLRGINCLLRI